jgi:hypothetical protein
MALEARMRRMGAGNGSRGALRRSARAFIGMEACGSAHYWARELKPPMLVTLIGVIGGVLAYGIAGLFIGPVVLAVAWDLADAWIHDSTAPG